MSENPYSREHREALAIAVKDFGERASKWAKEHPEPLFPLVIVPPRKRPKARRS